MQWNKVREYKRKDLLDEIEALECELNMAIDLMARVASRKQTVFRMGEWVSLNFPKFRDKLPKRMQALPPIRHKTKE